MINRSTARVPLARLRQLVPEGRSLPEPNWRARHLGIVILLWMHLPGIVVFGLVRGFSLAHVLVESAFVPVAALLAMSARVPRRLRTAVASVGLLSCSGVLVHLSGGLIEMHFHFFVTVAVVALYQDWVPFLAAIGYVLVHHGAVGAIDPQSVFNHPAALNSPWTWAAIHSLFITGISVVCLIAWRLNEQLLAERRGAEDRLSEETRVVRALHEVGKTLAADLDLPRVLQAVTDAGAELTGARYGAFFYNVVDASGEAYQLYTVSGAPREAFAKLGPPRNTPVFAATFDSEAVARFDDVTAEPHYGQLAPHHGMPKGHLPVRSYLAVPVRSRTGEVLGGLFFGHPQPARFSEVHQRLAVGIATHAGMAVDNARLYKAEQEARAAAEAARARLGVLAEAGRILASSLEPSDTLADLSRLVAASLSGYCLIDLLDEDHTIRRIAAGARPAAPGQAELIDSPAPDLADDSDPLARAIRTGRAQYLAAVPADTLPAEEVDAVPTCVLIAPMLGSRRQPLGAIGLVSVAGAMQLGEADLPFAEALARRAASAVEKARLYARQRTVAETLQRSLLPERMPDLPGLATAARYRAGGPDVEVGGDWYDVFQLTDGRIAFVIGDVVGHGERAAALMGQLRNAMRAYALQGCDGGECLGYLNRLLNSHQDMATMAYAVLDVETGDLRYTNAGHPPPLLASSDGMISLLDHHDPALGILPSVRYTEARARLEPGDTLLLYTDGLIEDRVTTIDDGIDRLRDAVRGAPPELGSLDGLCDHVMAAALAGRTPDDDVALVAVQLAVLGDRIHLRLPTRAAVLAPLRATLRRWLAESGASEQERFELTVAIGEACSNAIRHANLHPGGTFEIEATINGETIVRVRDRGRWRTPRDRDGGYGMAVMQAYTDQVEVLPTPTGTEVRLHRTLAAMKPEISLP